MSGSSTFSLDHHHHQLHNATSEQLCYVHCNFCDTVLAVSVPTTSLFKTVAVRCGHCTNLLSVNMRALLLPPANQLHLNHPLYSNSNSNHLEEMPMSPPPNFLVGHDQSGHEDVGSIVVKNGKEEPPRPQVVNRPPEKRQRVPSAYNRFIKEEIQRIKAGNPEISHREAFSAAAKNWAHFPHIHFGMGSNQTMKKVNSVCQQEGANLIIKDGLHSATDMGVTPY